MASGDLASPESLEIIALCSNQFAVRDIETIITYERKAVFDTRICSGDPLPCENVGIDKCDDVGGCASGSLGCETYELNCEYLNTEECETRPGCSLN
jgi:hypothetical protein